MAKNNKTKTLIFQTALKLLRKNHNLTLKDISSSANVNIAAINYYFGDKENLIKDIITDQLHSLKLKLNTFLDEFETSTDYEQTLCKLISCMYDFCFENLGLLNYIFSTDSKKIMQEAIFIYVHEISLDQEFMDKIMQTIAKISPVHSMDECKVKYTQLFSTFAFPIIFELNLLKVEVAYFNSIADPKFREQYVKQICKTFFED